MLDMIIVLVLLLVLGGAGLYIYKAKKQGKACIGCPHAKQCGSKCSCNCGNSEC